MRGVAQFHHDVSFRVVWCGKTPPRHNSQRQASVVIVNIPPSPWRWNRRISYAGQCNRRGVCCIFVCHEVGPVICAIVTSSNTRKWSSEMSSVWVPSPGRGAISITTRPVVFLQYGTGHGASLHCFFIPSTAIAPPPPPPPSLKTPPHHS